MNSRYSSLSLIHLAGIALAGLIAIALLVAPSRSQAADEPFRIDFDQSAMQFGMLSDLPLGELASTGSLDGTIDKAGNVTVPKGKFVLPSIGMTEPIAFKVFMGIESDATGTFDRKTGELVLNAKAGVWATVDLQALLGMLGTAGVELPVDSGILESVLGNVKELTCGFAPMDVTFTTGETSLGSGQPFVDGPLGPGAITAEWSQLGPFAGKTKILGLIDACQAIKMYAPQLIEGALGGAGGGVLPEGVDLGGLDIAALLENLDNVNLGPSSLTLSRTLDDNPVVGPPAGKPKLGISINPKHRVVRAGSKATYTVKVKNSGRAPAAGVKLCLKLRGPATIGGKNCRKLGKVMSGATQTRRFTVKTKPGKGKQSVRVEFELRSSNAKRSSTGAELLIRN